MLKDGEQEELLRETHEAVKGIEQLLKGYNGNPGLCYQVSNNAKHIRNIEIILATLITSSGVGFGLFKFLVG